MGTVIGSALKLARTSRMTCGSRVLHNHFSARLASLPRRNSLSHRSAFALALATQIAVRNSGGRIDEKLCEMDGISLCVVTTRDPHHNTGHCSAVVGWGERHKCLGRQRQ